MDHEAKEGQLSSPQSQHPVEEQAPPNTAKSRARKARVAPTDPTENLLAFPVRKARGLKRTSAMHIACKQRCLVCNSYGCDPLFVTPVKDGGEATGDNLLPVCPLHRLIPLDSLYAEYPQIHRWLEERDRIDAIVELKRLLVKHGRRTVW